MENTLDHHDQYDQVDDNTAEYVEPVESGNEEKEVGVLGWTIFVAIHVRTVNIRNAIIPDLHARCFVQVVCAFLCDQVMTCGGWH